MPESAPTAAPWLKDDPTQTNLEARLSKIDRKLELLKATEGAKALKAKANLGGRWIYVMNSAGAIFAGRGVADVIHHSSFLAGGAVAGAGEIQIAGGQLKAIDNVSGHYMPGPAYRWQVVKQLEHDGVPLAGVRVGIARPT